MSNEAQYQAGREYAEFWIRTGGDLVVQDSPDSWSDAKCNGFHDRLTEERNK
jgi:hypothetical protein